MINSWCGVAQYVAAWPSIVRRGPVWCGVAQSWCGVAQHGAAWPSMLRRGPVWCGVAQYGAAWPSHGAAWPSMVRRGPVWCGVAQLVARRLAVRQARVRFSARHHREVFPTEQTSGEEMENGDG